MPSPEHHTCCLSLGEILSSPPLPFVRFTAEVPEAAKKLYSKGTVSRPGYSLI